MRSRVIALVACVGLFASASPASALAILGQYTPFATGPDNVPAQGGGNIEDVFEAAATLWEQAILDNQTVTIPYGWVPGSTGLGFSDGISIFISADLDWFVDLTPDQSEEYSSPALTSATLGGTTLNYAMGFTGGTGVANGYDLLTVLLHEIGHVLGSQPSAFVDYADGDVDVTAPRPLAGLSLPVTGVHLGTPAGYSGLDPLMFPFIDAAQRRLISDADLLFIAQGGEWEQLDPARFAAVPEPATFTLVSLSLMGLTLRRRR